MILKTREEAYDFLLECLLNIFRINSTYLTDSEKNIYEVEKKLNLRNLTCCEEKISFSDIEKPDLPMKISPSILVQNIKSYKLEILILIYNKTTLAVKQVNANIDLKTIFQAVKSEIECSYQIKSEKIMCTPRSHIERAILYYLPFFESLLKSESQNFLNKFGFFETGYAELFNSGREDTIEMTAVNTPSKSFL